MYYTTLQNFINFKNYYILCLIDEIEKLNFNCDWKWSMKEVELEVEQNQKNYNELYLQIEV